MVFINNTHNMGIKIPTSTVVAGINKEVRGYDLMIKKKMSCHEGWTFLKENEREKNKDMKVTIICSYIIYIIVCI